MTIPKRQRELERLIAEHFPGPAHSPESNGTARSFRPSPPMGDDEIIELCGEAKNAPKFASLFYDGDASAYDDDDSDADAALLAILAFYTQNPDQLDRIFRKSALYRQKWERADYRQRTIDFAVKNLTETYHPYDGAQLVVGHKNVSSSTDSLRENDDDDTSDDIPGLVCFAHRPAPDPVKFVLEKVLALGYVGSVHGAGGFGKSVIAMLVAISVSGYQKQCIGLNVLKHGAVLYLDSELDERGQHPRVKEICRGLDIPVPKDLHYISTLGLDTATAFDRAFKACKKLDITMVVIDSWGPLMEGDMESAKDVIRFYNNYLKPFIDLGVTVLIVDHQAHTQEGQNYQKKGAFGSVYKENLARSVLQIERVNDEGVEDVLKVRLRHKKSNFGPRIEPFDVKIKFGSGKITATWQAITQAHKAKEETLSGRERILAALTKGPSTVKELVADTDLSTGTVRNLLSELVPSELESADLDGRTKVYGYPDDIKNLSSSPSPRESGNDDKSSDGNGSGSKTYRGTGTDAQKPLSYDLQPGQQATLEELRERRQQQESEDNGLIAAGWRPKDRGKNTMWISPDNGFAYSKELALKQLKCARAEEEEEA